MAEMVRSRVALGLADEPGKPLATAPWIGAFVVLGSMLRHYLPQVGHRQLVLAISVPRRHYAAALIGAGWVLSSPAPKLAEPIDVFRSADSSTYLRAVTDKLILTGRFLNLEENRRDPRVLTGEKLLPVARHKAVVELDGATQTVIGQVPSPGFLAEFTGAAATWLERLASPPMDLALIGTARWLRQDLDAVIGNGADGGTDGTPLAAYVLPDDDDAATWSTPVIPSARLSEGETLPKACRTAILDGYGAIKYLNDITVPIVVCVVDRSIADESAAETIIEARLSNSQPISVVKDLRWNPPRAVEALAFTVAV
ncbi:hypothetical protein NQ854_07690 [Rhodococcus ruber]|uniref:hypothetical protein n=1 Tax=Rhodococcus ruber TaxID=1830 RepID=UPI00387DCA83